MQAKKFAITFFCRRMPAMTKKASIPLQFRVSLDLWEDIKQVSADMGISQPALVRLCVTAMIHSCKENNVRTLPDDWAAIISRMDGRRTHHPDEEKSTPTRKRKPK